MEEDKKLPVFELTISEDYSTGVDNIFFTDNPIVPFIHFTKLQETKIEQDENN